MRTGNRSTNRTSDDTSAVNFRDVCDCLVLFQADRVFQTYDTTTQEMHTLDFDADIQEFALSPDARRIAALDANASAVSIIDVANNTQSTAYRATTPDFIGQVRWSQDGQWLVVSLSQKPLAESYAEVFAKRLIAVELATGAVQAVAAVGQAPFGDQDVGLVSLGASKDLSQVIFHSSGLQNRAWIWTRATGAIREAPPESRLTLSEYSFSLRALPITVSGETMVFDAQAQKISFMNLDNFQVRDLPLSSTSEQPIGWLDLTGQWLPVLYRPGSDRYESALGVLDTVSGAVRPVAPSSLETSIMDLTTWVPDRSGFLIQHPSAGVVTYVPTAAAGDRTARVSLPDAFQNSVIVGLAER